MIRIFNVVYDTDGKAIDLPTTFQLPNRTIRTKHRPTIGDRLSKAIEGDWLVSGFDYQLPGDPEPTSYKDPWVGSPHHLAVKAKIAAYGFPPAIIIVRTAEAEAVQ